MNYRQVKKILKTKYRILKSRKLATPYHKNKLKHSFYILKIAKQINSGVATQCYKTFLLHDIGRFVHPLNDNNHAFVGYKILKHDYKMKEQYILPIKYHECDIDWENRLSQDDMFEDLSLEDKKKVIYLTKLLKDADVISNMMSLNNKKNIINFSITQLEYLDNFLHDSICRKYEYTTHADDLIYILCGIYILNLDESKQFVKDKKIVIKILQKLYKRNHNPDIKNKIIKCLEKYQKEIDDGKK